MASSSTTSPAGSTPPLTTDEHPKALATGSTASTKMVVDVPVAPPSVPGEATDPREGFVFPLVDPWDNEPLREVLRRWCSATHTFFFAWGELILTLEDIANHWMLPILDFRDNLPLVYRWVGLKTWDHDLVASLDFEENMLLRPYGEDHPNFTCVSVLSRFNQLTSLIHELRAEDHQSLAYLSAVNPGWLPILSATGLKFTPYCPQRVKRQFGLDQDVPASLQEATPPFPSLAPFIKSCSFAYWEGKVNRVMIPSGHRFDLNIMSMNAYWQRLAHAMVRYVNSGRSNKAPISSHCKLQISSLCFSPPSQSAMAYRNSQKLGFAEWDETRSGWIVYTTHFPKDPAVENGSKKPTHSPKKASSKKTKAGKKSKSVAPVPKPEKESTTTPSETAIESAAALSKAKGMATGSSKRKSAAVPSLEGIGKQAASSKVGKKSVALRHPKDQRKPATSSSSSDEEQPSAIPTRSRPKKKKSVIPPSSDAIRIRSKSGSKAMRKFGGPSGAVVVVEDSDTVADDISLSFSDRDDPLAAATDQGEDIGKRFEGDFEADVGSTEGSHSIAGDSFSDVAPGSMDEEQMTFVGYAVDGDDVPEATELNVESADLIRHSLAIVTHASCSFDHGRDDSDVVDSDAMPLSFYVPQMTLTGGIVGFGTPMAYVMEGVSLFGAIPRLGIILAGGIIIPASRIIGEDPSIGEFLVVSEIHVPKEVHTQGFVKHEFAANLGVAPEVYSNIDSAVDHGTQVEGTSSPAATTPAGGEHLENIGTGDVIHMSKEVVKAGVTGEVMVASRLPRPMAGMGSSVEVGAISGEVADFFREFDKRTLNPHLEWHFWKFNGPLVSFGDFWVPSDSVPYLQQLIAKHGNFVTKFRFGAGFGGPMLSLFSSVLAAMSKFDFGSVTKIAQHLFGKQISDEMQALRHQIALLQDSLAVLATYKAGVTGEVMVASRLPRPMAGMGSSVEVGAISGEVADFFREFDKRTLNPHLEWHFWKFNGPLVSFGDFWVPSDSVPYLQQLIAKHGNFVTKFRFGAGFGGPMLSLFSSVLAAMSKFDFGSVTKIAQHLFGKQISDEMQALRHQIALLQDSLAVLATYKEEMRSTGVTAPEFEHSKSLFDSLIN
uniref:Aminotransferase-like plant mobile domain-containing protein n=1 Tax=Fagus sylvatica TaxID=28930 RepID=A0A2N9IL47_FAGSY